MRNTTAHTKRLQMLLLCQRLQGLTQVLQVLVGYPVDREDEDRLHAA
jgi:hypothetical protein